MLKVNLATLCLRLCEEIEEYFVDSSYLLRPKPSTEAFEKEIVLDEDTYRALFVVICGMSDAFHKGKDEIVISTCQRGIVITGFKVADKDLYDLCSIESGKFLIQKSRLGIALAFLQQEQVKIEQIREKRGGIRFVFPEEV